MLSWLLVGMMMKSMGPLVKTGCNQGYTSTVCWLVVLKKSQGMWNIDPCYRRSSSYNSHGSEDLINHMWRTISCLTQNSTSYLMFYFYFLIFFYFDSEHVQSPEGMKLPTVSVSGTWTSPILIVNGRSRGTGKKLARRRRGALWFANA